MNNHRLNNLVSTATMSPERKLRDGFGSSPRLRINQRDPELSLGAGGASRRGFTITELLVVIGLIVLLIAVGLPSIGAMFASGRLQNAVATVESTVAAGRAYATLDKVVTGGGGYRGGGVVFTPNNQIRIIRNTEYNGNEPIYTDAADPVSLPPDIAVVGIYKGNATYISAPAFGVRFDQHGVLQSRSPGSSATNHEWDMLFYDSNGDGDSGDTNATDKTQNYDYDDEPFVVGVIVYNEADMVDQVTGGSLGIGEWLSSSGGDARYDWIMQNGVPLLFNRYSGSVVKED